MHKFYGIGLMYTRFFGTNGRSEKRKVVILGSGPFAAAAVIGLPMLGKSNSGQHFVLLNMMSKFFVSQTTTCTHHR